MSHTPLQLLPPSPNKGDKQILVALTRIAAGIKAQHRERKGMKSQGCKTKPQKTTQWPGPGPRLHGDPCNNQMCIFESQLSEGDFLSEVKTICIHKLTKIKEQRCTSRILILAFVQQQTNHSAAYSQPTRPKGRTTLPQESNTLQVRGGLKVFVWILLFKHF